MATDDIFVQKSRDGLSISFFKGAGFYPFGKVINSNDNITKSSEGFGKRAHDVNSNLKEGDGVFGNRFQWSFSTAAVTFLAGFA
jgi:hypothetical protein